MTFYKIWEHKIKFMTIYCDLCVLHWADNNIDFRKEKKTLSVTLICTWIFKRLMERESKFFLGGFKSQEIICLIFANRTELQKFMKKNTHHELFHKNHQIKEIHTITMHHTEHYRGPSVFFITNSSYQGYQKNAPYNLLTVPRTDRYN